ncbi:MAG: carboxylesterase family protein [Vicinamibacterales bacterium]
MSASLGVQVVSHHTPLRARAQGVAAPQDAIVSTRYGRIRGTRVADVCAFKGVPYGASTAGSSRFRPPSPPSPWTGIRDTTRYGPRATQPVRRMIPELGDALTGSGPMSEDCLRVNVWSGGLASTDKRPVMVFLHGGGYQTGSGNSALYDGSALARKHGVVVVTVTHRLNALGFLYLEQLGGAEWRDATNLGLLDIVSALEWVRDNVAAFGGDPGCVTLFGESGGAAKTCMVMAMPSARGLFHRAIAQSTLVDMAIRGWTPDQATRWAEFLIARLGLTPTQLERLRELPVDRIIAAQVEAQAGRRHADDDGKYLATNFYPVTDGRTVPTHPFDPVAPAASADVPLLCGSTEHEVSPYLDAAMLQPLDATALRDRVQAVLRVDAGTADRVIALYRSHRPDSTNLSLATIITSDNSVMRASEYIMAERKAAQGKAPAFLYYFQWPSPVRDGRLGAMHGVELPFVFDNAAAVPEMVGRGAELVALAEQVTAAWVAFARTGNPSVAGRSWPAFEARTRPTMVFNVESRVVSDPYAEERHALEAIRAAQASLPPFAPPGCASVVCGNRW